MNAMFFKSAKENAKVVTTNTKFLKNAKVVSMNESFTVESKTCVN